MNLAGQFVDMLQVAERGEGKSGEATPTIVTETMLEDILGVSNELAYIHVAILPDWPCTHSTFRSSLACLVMVFLALFLSHGNLSMSYLRG